MSDRETAKQHRVMIVGGGDLTPAFLRERLEAYPDAFVIAADRGLEVLRAVGRRPDHLLGDLDSAAPETVAAFRQAGRDMDIYPAEKDFTDTEAAIRYAIGAGAEELILVGMTGGRLDHFLANVQNMLIPLEAGVRCVMEDPQNRLSLIRGGQSLTLKRETAFGKYLSLIPLTDTLKGLTLTGVKYPLDHAAVRKGASLCVSNEMAGEESRISLDAGVAAVILSADRGEM